MQKQITKTSDIHEGLILLDPWGNNRVVLRREGSRVFLSPIYSIHDKKYVIYGACQLIGMGIVEAEFLPAQKIQTNDSILPESVKVYQSLNKDEARLVRNLHILTVLMVSSILIYLFI